MNEMNGDGYATVAVRGVRGQQHAGRGSVYGNRGIGTPRQAIETAPQVGRPDTSPQQPKPQSRPYSATKNTANTEARKQLTSNQDTTDIIRGHQTQTS